MENIREKVKIRRLRPEDSYQIDRIYSAIVKKDAVVDSRKIISHLIDDKENASFVAEIEGKVVGFMISYILSGGFGMIEKSAWIAMLGVDPRYMGQGIGKMLAEEIFKFYRKKKIKTIYTSVRWDSVDLLSFFKTLGFDRSNFINLRKTLR